MTEQTQKKKTTEQVSEMQRSASQNKVEELSQRLFEYAMKDQWDKVVEAYNKEKPESHTAKITKAEDTALHLAVSGGKFEFVYKMVGILGENASNVLKAKNKGGNTPLHTAAALGNARMCHCMASEHPNLLTVKNKRNQTPFYLAAQFGHKDAFLCLYFCYQGNHSDILSTDEVGNTILHAAIDGEYFDLAFQILWKYPQLVNAVNLNGLSPLHILATKTKAFQSGSRLGLFERILYRCIIVDELKDTKNDSKDYLKRFEENGIPRLRFPQNYETCVRFFQMFFGVACYGMPNFIEMRSFGWSRFLSCINDKNSKSNSTSDEENPHGTSKITQGESSSSQTKSGSNNSNGAVKVSSDTGIGNGTIVDELKGTKYDSEGYLKRFEEDGNRGRRPWFPQNYEICVPFCRMFFDGACYGLSNFVGICSGGSHFLSCINDKNYKSKSISDEENPHGTSKITQGESSSSQTKSESNSNGAVEISSDTGIDNVTSPEAKKDREDESHPAEENRQQHLPANYATFIQIFKFMMKFLWVILGLGFQRIKKITTKKQRHRWASQVMNKLIENTSMYKYSGGGGVAEDFPCNPSPMTSSSHRDTITVNGKNSQAEILNKEGKCQSETGSVDSTSKQGVQMKFEKKADSESTKLETRSPILIAASNGITEMVDKILEKYPVAIQDVDAEDRNVMLVAVVNRQTQTFQFLIERKVLHESVFRHWDKQGNNALHLAATYGHYRPWLIPGSALQMQWERKWYKFVKKSLAKYLLVHYNNKGQTPKQIFTETHKELVKEGSEWLTKTSESCSVVAALIATVAFATASSIPGGVDQRTGEPVLRDEPAFGVFALSSVVALCFSITALVFFLAILTSRFEEKDFATKLPRKLIVGLTSLFTSIAAMLVSFCAGHFFELKDKLKFAAFPIYTATCLPISFFALAQLPLYFDLLRAIFKKVPQRSYN